MQLIIAPNLSDVDTIYQRLIDLHANRDESDSRRVNMRLIFALINHIGDKEVALEAIALAGKPRKSKGMQA